MTPQTVTHQAPLSMGFPKKEYWSGLPFPPPGDLPDTGVKLMSLVFPALPGGFFTTKPPGKPKLEVGPSQAILDSEGGPGWPCWPERASMEACV